MALVDIIYRELESSNHNSLTENYFSEKSFQEVNNNLLKKTNKSLLPPNFIDLKQNRRQAAPGFSLIEVLIAMSIVFFLLVGTAEMLCYSLLLKQKADTHRIAADLISQKLETLKSLRADDVLLTPGTHQETIKDKNSDRLFLLSWDVAESSDGLKKVSLSLYPAPYGSKPPVRAVFYLSRSLEF